MKPRNPSGLFVRYSPQFLRYSNELAYGCYFPTTLAASRAIGYLSDRVGKEIRNNKGTRREGLCGLITGWGRAGAFMFITVEKALKGWIGLDEARWKNPGLFEAIRAAKAAAGV